MHQWIAAPIATCVSLPRLLLQRRERPSRIDEPAAHHGEERFEAADLLRRHACEILRQHREIGEPAGRQRAAPAVVMGELGATLGVEPQGFLAARQLIGIARRRPGDRLAVDHPLQ